MAKVRFIMDYSTSTVVPAGNIEIRSFTGELVKTIEAPESVIKTDYKVGQILKLKKKEALQFVKDHPGVCVIDNYSVPG